MGYAPLEDQQYRPDDYVEAPSGGYSNTKPEDVLRDKIRRGEQKNVQHSAI